MTHTYCIVQFFFGQFNPYPAGTERGLDYATSIEPGQPEQNIQKNKMMESLSDFIEEFVFLRGGGGGGIKTFFFFFFTILKKK